MESLPPVFITVIGLIAVSCEIASWIYDPTESLLVIAKGLSMVYTTLSLAQSTRD